jgi:acyl-coenzyme A synthetase/AMP-(fatty) acid ligase
MVCARVRTTASFSTEAEGVKELRRHCRRNLAPYKVPVKIEFTNAPLAAVRHKKLRKSAAAA